MDTKLSVFGEVEVEADTLKKWIRHSLPDEQLKYLFADFSSDQKSVLIGLPGLPGEVGVSFDFRHAQVIRLCSKHLQRVLIEAAKLAPRWNPQLHDVHERELTRGSRNRATLAVARKLVAYLRAVDTSGRAFVPRVAAEA